MTADAYWHIKIEETVYGPYSDAHMSDYITEGRLIPSTLITADKSRGFFEAVQYPFFKDQFDALSGLVAPTLKQVANGGAVATEVTPVSAPMPVQAPAPVETAPSIEKPSLVDPVIGETVLLIMAEIRSDDSMGFFQALNGFGTAQRIGDSVWLLRGALDLNVVRNTLSQTLTREDRLFILDSFKNDTVWFNIGADLDTRIRDMWDMER